MFGSHQIFGSDIHAMTLSLLRAELVFLSKFICVELLSLPTQGWYLHFVGPALPQCGYEDVILTRLACCVGDRNEMAVLERVVGAL